MTDAAPLGRDEIIGLLIEVADQLVDLDERPTIAVVGGSFLALRGLRAGTKDVDSVRRLDSVVKAAVEEVARRHDLDSTWLNDKAAGYFPQGCAWDEEIFLDLPTLLVVGPHPDAVFLMKLYAVGAARLHDYDDLVLLWPSCSFTAPGAAAAAFAAGYPHAPEDPYLESYIAEIAAAAV